MPTGTVRRRRFAGLVAVTSLALALTACGADEADPAEGGDSAEIKTPALALTHPAYLTFLPGVVGPLEYGGEFGLDYTEDDLVTYDSHAVAMQAVLAGRSDVVLGSTASALTVNTQEPEFKIFGAVHQNHDLVIAAKSGITSVDDLFESDIRFGSDSPGGSGSMALQAMLESERDDRSPSDLPGLIVLESSGERATALGTDSLDAAVINSSQFLELDTAQPGNFHTLVELDKAVPDYLASSLAAPASQFKENPEGLAALHASIIMASREMIGDFDLFAEMAEKYLPSGAPDEAVLEHSWNRIRDNGIWSVNGEVPDESVENMIHLARAQGLFDQETTVDDAFDGGPSERALELVGGSKDISEFLD